MAKAQKKNSGKWEKADKAGKPAPVARRSKRLGELIGKTLTPLCRKQGFASSDIVRFWGEIVGPQFADCTEPDRIRWPRRGEADGFHPGTLVVHCEGAQSVFLQHEEATVIQRVNAYFGYPAIDKLHILQRPVSLRRKKKPEPLRALTPSEEAQLDNQLKAMEDDKMASALKRLGHAITVKSG